MITLDTLPRHGVIRVYATADVITSESAAHGDAAARGWVDDLDSTELEESRNYVRPVFECRVESFDDDAREVLADTVARLGAHESDDGCTLYGCDGVTWDYATDAVWLYALHGHVKHFDAARGWVEDAVVIA